MNKSGKLDCLPTLLLVLIWPIIYSFPLVSITIFLIIGLIRKR